MDQLTATTLLTKLQLAHQQRSGLSAKITSQDLAEQDIEELLNDSSLTESERENARKAVTATQKEIDAVQFSADLLLRFLPAPLAGELKRIPVGTLPDLDLNAAMLLISPDQPIVVVNTGLWDCFFHVASWWASAGDMASAPAEISIVDATQNIFRAMLFYHTRDPDWLPGPAFASKYEQRRNMIGGLWTNAVNFVLGHEYAHVLLGHLPPDRAGSGQLTLDPRDAPDMLLPSYAQEFEADAKATEIAFSFSRLAHQENPLITAAGIELALQVLRLKNDLFPPKRKTVNHPPAAQRLSAVRKAVAAQHGENIVELVAGMSHTFDRTVTIGKAVLKTAPLAS